MKTRSTGKSEVMIMLAEDRKTALLQDFDKEGHQIFVPMASQREKEADELVMKYLCGWADKDLLTRANFAIAGFCFCFALYVISETTLFFENTAQFFTGMQPPTAQLMDKSMERFLANNYVLLCLLGPSLVLALTANFYIQYYWRDLQNLSKCERTKEQSSKWLCCRRSDSGPKMPSPSQSEPVENSGVQSEIDESDAAIKREKIVNRKKTPARVRKDSPSPEKKRARKPSRSPVKKASASPAKKSKKSLETKDE